MATIHFGFPLPIQRGSLEVLHVGCDPFGFLGPPLRHHSSRFPEITLQVILLHRSFPTHHQNPNVRGKTVKPA